MGIRPETGVTAGRKLLKRLKRAGMIRIGNFSLQGLTIRLAGQDKAPREPGIYVFELDGTDFVYLGTSRHGIAGRISTYSQPSSRHRPVTKMLIEALQQAHTVTAWMLPLPDETFHGLPVSLAVGLEAGLLMMFNPAWNVPGSEAAFKAHDTRRAKRAAAMPAEQSLFDAMPARPSSSPGRSSG